MSRKLLEKPLAFMQRFRGSVGDSSHAEEQDAGTEHFGDSVFYQQSLQSGTGKSDSSVISETQPVSLYSAELGKPTRSVWFIDPHTLPQSNPMASSSVPVQIPNAGGDLGDLDYMERGRLSSLDRRPVRKQPEGTVAYTVKGNDTLASVAAHFDVTPSAVMKLNKMSSRTIFAGQVLYLPDPDAAVTSLTSSSASSSPLTSPTHPTPASSRPAMDIPLVKMADKPPQHVPGHVERQTPTNSQFDLPHKLSEEEAKKLDEECLARFLKFSCKFISDGKGIVGGTMIVTPNAAMFEPNVSDPLVLENGRETYGMCLKMEQIMVAAMYHDISAIKYVGSYSMTEGAKSQTDMHEKHCRLYKPESSNLQSNIPAGRKDSIEAEDQCSCGTSTPDSLASPKASYPDPHMVMTNGSSGADIQVNMQDVEQFVNQIIQESVNITTGQTAANHNSAIPLSLENVDLYPLPRKDSAANNYQDLVKDTVPSPVMPVEASHSEVLCHLIPSQNALNDVVGQESESVTEKVPTVPDTKENNASDPVIPLVPTLDTQQTEAGSTGLAESLRGKGKGAIQVLTQNLSNLVTYGRNSLTGEDKPADRDEAFLVDHHIEVESAIKPEDKPGLFRMVTDLMPKPAAHYEDPPLYLYIKTGRPRKPIKNDTRYPIRPCYWYSIPRANVDQLYAFFLHWSPGTYGEEGDMDPSERGFVVVEDNVPEQDVERDLYIVDEHFSNRQKMFRDWEMLNVEEAWRRQSLDAGLDSISDTSPLDSLPEMIGQSALLSEDQIRMISNHLPARTIGNPWTLVYSNELHGFSLKTLYRHMHHIDSPVLLVVKDTNQNVFGALVSEAFKQSDLFYGSGETFLFTFYPEFTLYRWTGINNFHIKGNEDSLGIGCSEGMFGLWLDGDLFLGRSHRCATYDNDTLTSSEDFHVKGVEAWTFMSSDR